MEGGKSVRHWVKLLKTHIQILVYKFNQINLHLRYLGTCYHNYNLIEIEELDLEMLLEWHIRGYARRYESLIWYNLSIFGLFQHGAETEK